MNEPQPKWFYGVEHVTIDSGGYVKWKGEIIDHYHFSKFGYCDKGKAAVEELAERCRHLESIGFEINIQNIVWHWDKYAPQRG